MAISPCKRKEVIFPSALCIRVICHGHGDTGVKYFSGLNNEDERRSSLLTIAPVSLHYHKRRTDAPHVGVGHRSNNEREKPLKSQHQRTHTHPTQLTLLEQRTHPPPRPLCGQVPCFLPRPAPLLYVLPGGKS